MRANVNLCQNRALTALDLLLANDVKESAIFARGEQFKWNSNVPYTHSRYNLTIENQAINHGESTSGIQSRLPNVDTIDFVGWQGNQPKTQDWEDNPVPEHEASRSPYRRAEIWVAYSSPNQPEPAKPVDSSTQPTLRRALIPGKDTFPVTVPPAQEPRTAKRIRITVEWDSPTVLTAADWIPTLAELIYEWESRELALPSEAGLSDNNTVKPVADPQAGNEVFRITANWGHDPRSGQTLFGLSLSSLNDAKEGLFFIGEEKSALSSRAAAMAFAVGPALIGGIEVDSIGDGVGVGALLAAIAVATEQFVDTGKVIFTRVAMEQRQQELDELVTGSRQRVMFDYMAEIGINIDEAGIKIITKQPMRLAYKQVGVQVDHRLNDDGSKKAWHERFSLFYDEAKLDIADPGQWEIDGGGALGSLIRVSDVRTGAGSLWLEVDLEFAIDLGVVSIDSTTIRLDIADDGKPAVSVRGFGASVTIPGTLTGSGRLQLTQGGLQAALDLTVIPAQIGVMGALAIRQDPQTGVRMVHIFVLVQFAAGIPLASSGLGIYGFAGRFVSNGTRQLDPAVLGVNQADMIGREMAWFALREEQKYTIKAGQWVIGFGALVGSLPDAGFSLNAFGMFTVEFPEPAVIFSIDAKLIKPIPKEAQSQYEGAEIKALELLGLIAIDREGIKLGVRGKYTIKPLLEVKVPVDAFFPFGSDALDFFLRIGSDGVESEDRFGDPVTVTYLPELFAYRAWGYLMIEGSGLRKLGGDPALSFGGFALGLGIGHSIDWSAGPIKLHASASLLVGVGMKPLMVAGKLSVNGELVLVKVSISASGKVTFKLLEDKITLKGEFCGSVELLFWEMEGCVDVKLEGSAEAEPAEPPAPVSGVDLSNRYGQVVASATTDTAGTEHTAWIDTIPVLQFDHWTAVNAGRNNHFKLAQPYHGTPWWGSSELKYAYRLTGVELTDQQGQRPPLIDSKPLPAYWWQPSHRPAFLLPAGNGQSSGGDPDASEHESWRLSLMSYDVAPWARMIRPDDKGQNRPGDPAEAIRRLCDRREYDTPFCVYGADGKRSAIDQMKLEPRLPEDMLYQRPVAVTLSERGLHTPLLAAVRKANRENATIERGRVIATPGSVDLGVPEAHLYRLPQRVGFDGFEYSLPVAGEFSSTVYHPSVRLAFWLLGDEPDYTATVCDRFQDLEDGAVFKTLERPLQFGASLRYEYSWGLSVGSPPPIPVPGAFAESDTWLLFNRGGNLFIDIPTDDILDIQLYLVNSVPEQDPFGIEYFDAAGQVIDRLFSSHNQFWAPRLHPEPGRPIRRISISLPKDRAAWLAQICFYRQRVSQPNAKDLLRDENLPALTFIHEDGSEDVVQPGAPNLPDHRHPLITVNYAPERGPAYRGFRIPSRRLSRVGLIEACGIHWGIQQLIASNRAAQDALKDQINNSRQTRADGETQQPLLRPDATYTLRVRWQWQAWQGDGEPGEPATDKWQDGTPVSYRFKTAAEGTQETLPELPDELRGREPIREDVFEPALLSRYLISFEPDIKSAPHFLDDPLAAHFRVGYIDQILQQYGYKLRYRLRQTDPPSGAAADGPLPDVPVQVSYEPLPDCHLADSDRRIREAAENSTCVNAPRVGASAQVDAELLPGREYDLLIVAAKNDRERTIGRAHFRTSIYQNPAQMLTVLGFAMGGQVNPVLPHDAIVSDALPSSPILDDDTALDEALRSVGLDPWVISPQPRTTVFWRSDNNRFRLVGVLLEANEPIERTDPLCKKDRLLVQQLRVNGTTFELLRRNTGRSRLLYVPTQPLALSTGGIIALQVSDLQRQRTWQRRVHYAPRLAYQEGLAT